MLDGQDGYARELENSSRFALSPQSISFTGLNSSLNAGSVAWSIIDLRSCSSLVVILSRPPISTVITLTSDCRNRYSLQLTA